MGRLLPTLREFADALIREQDRLDREQKEALKMSPATVTLTEEQIKLAIDAYVSAEGYAVGKVTLAFHPAGQIDRGEFTATVEVTPRPARADSCYDRETPR